MNPAIGDLDVTERVVVGGLSVARCLHEFVVDELLPVTNVAPDRFWSGLERLIDELGPVNRELLDTRARLQSQLDEWHRDRAGRAHDPSAYAAFLREIGYLLPEPVDFEISTTGTDPEIASIAGPQLIVPVLNARFALNAVNARWGSLYDALYGSDVIDETGGAGRDGPYNPVRGERVVNYVRAFLDEAVPLERGSHADVSSYVVDGARLVATGPGGQVGLAKVEQLRGYRGAPKSPSALLFVHHGLHVEITIDGTLPVGARDRAGVCDVQVESALTVIVDFEDSIAAVDAFDKVAAYRNWLGLNRGDLKVEMAKGETTFVRELAADREYVAPDGEVTTMPGRALLCVRNVGHLMTTDAILDARGDEIGEGILDAVITSAAALPGLDPANPRQSSRTGSIYIVKPKQHSPDEVGLTVRLFAGIENLLGLPRNTVKLGLMDEERRLSINLKAAVHAAQERIVFINTGFLDRSGDEIHTSMQAGPIARKAELKSSRWISTYEDHNVDIGLAAGLSGRAQIGKGMWTMPDLMADMVAQKIAHPRAGASTAWVPSPTAATLHALHYHRVDVWARQAELTRRRTDPEGLLDIPLADPTALSPEERQEELDTNVQSILGYVVRWIDQGVGCSKVPNYHDVALMEDRATLRISSQLLANWLAHGIVSPEQVHASLLAMASVVDRQNAGDPDYRPMAEDPSHNLALQTAAELIFDGAAQPSGYTEPILHLRRREYKRRTSSNGCDVFPPLPGGDFVPSEDPLDECTD